MSARPPSPRALHHPTPQRATQWEARTHARMHARERACAGEHPLPSSYGARRLLFTSFTEARASCVVPATPPGMYVGTRVGWRCVALRAAPSLAQGRQASAAPLPTRPAPLLHTRLLLAALPAPTEALNPGASIGHAHARARLTSQAPASQALLRVWPWSACVACRHLAPCHAAWVGWGWGWAATPCRAQRYIAYRPHPALWRLAPSGFGWTALSLPPAA